MANKIILVIAIIMGVSVYFLSSGDLAEYENKAIKEFTNLPTTERRAIVEEFAETKNIPASSYDDLYACVSQMIFTKNTDLTFGKVAGWCDNDYKNNRLNGYIDFDNFENGFSKWDGSFAELESIIKNNMNDSNSYEHVSTTYRFILNDNQSDAVVNTKFKGTNALGAVVTNQVSALVDIKTGKIKKILNQ
ncbi:hypothetical protein [Methylophaga sp.]|uniref:hypothetical protein n=1 Tax=Methylophaga sp. TaxID=2024840 RepID=UPI003A8CE5F2